MIELTQTTLHPRGNCWQTAVACLLEVPIEALPSQYDAYVQVEDPDGKPRWDLRYNNALQAYLKKHHGLAYVELHYPDESYQQLRIFGWHLMTGATVRSEAQGGDRHVVVGHDGQIVWDPHPSRAGLLLGDVRWAVLCRFPKAWARGFLHEPCICPCCGTNGASAIE